MEVAWDLGLRTCDLEFGTWILALNPWDLDLGIWILGLRSWHLDLGIGNLRLGTRNLGLGTWDLRFAIHSDESMLALRLISQFYPYKYWSLTHFIVQPRNATPSQTTSFRLSNLFYFNPRHFDLESKALLLDT